MTAEVAKGAVAAMRSYPKGDINHNTYMNQTPKKSRETERRRRRRKQKKNMSVGGEETNTEAAVKEDGALGGEYNAKENSDPQKVLEQVEIEYIPEKAEFDGFMADEFRKVFERFTFKETAASEETEKDEETTANAAPKKKASSDSDEEEEEDANKRTEVASLIKRKSSNEG